MTQGGFLDWLEKSVRNWVEAVGKLLSEKDGLAELIAVMNRPKYPASSQG